MKKEKIKNFIKEHSLEIVITAGMTAVGTIGYIVGCRDGKIVQARRDAATVAGCINFDADKFVAMIKNAISKVTDKKGLGILETATRTAAKELSEITLEN